MGKLTWEYGLKKIGAIDVGVIVIAHFENPAILS